nr:hypothetical protein [uncultured Blautia sp.]
MRYWEDGLKRCCGHQVFPTIIKTSYLGPEAGVQKKAEIVEHVTKI